MSDLPIRRAPNAHIAPPGYEASPMAEVSPEWTAELKKGPIQLCLLALLAKGEKYGFQILRPLRDKSNGFFDLKEATLHPALRRVLERGRALSRRRERRSGRAVQYDRLEGGARPDVVAA